MPFGNIRRLPLVRDVVWVCLFEDMVGDGVPGGVIHVHFVMVGGDDGSCFLEFLDGESDLFD